MLNRLWSIVVKELIQYLRDPLLLGMTLVVPAIELILIGGTIGGGVSGVPIAVIDRDRSPISREVVAALDNTKELSVTHRPETLDQAHALIDAGRASALVVIPEGFATDVQSGRTAQVQLIVDGSNVAVAGEVEGVAQGAIETIGWDIRLAAVSSANLSRGGIDLRQEALYNQALDDKPYEMTAVLAFIVFEVVSLSAIMSIVKERESGTLEQIAITPIRQVELILAKASSPLIIGMINFVLLFGAVRLVFGLPLRGSIILMAALTALYLISEVCVALMISTVSRTQAQAITIVFIWFMLALTLSGFLVPITRLPVLLQTAAGVLPLQHYIEIVRSIMLKGAGLHSLWPHALALLGLDVVVIGVTAFMLRRVGK